MSDRRRAVADAQKAWPAVQIDEDDFLAYAAARLEEDNLSHLADLYLACGCERGDSAAIAAFDGRFMPRMARALSKIRLDDTEIDEVQQQVRQLLFMDDKGPRRIGAYSGTGALGAWVTTLALRVGLDFLRGVKRERQHRDVLHGVLGDEVDSGPELDLLKRTYTEQLRAAFGAGIEQLPPDERLVLRLHYLDGLSTTRIGALHQQHPVTVLRQLGRARKHLLSHIKKFLRTQLGVTQTQLESIVRLVKSDFHMTLSQVLGATETGQTKRPRE